MRSPPPSTHVTFTKSSSSPWWCHSSWALASSSSCSGLASMYESPRVPTRQLRQVPAFVR
ncbi:hypothetical protein LEMLEM_LOCUS10423 [Lemmus lemmus]